MSDSGVMQACLMALAMCTGLASVAAQEAGGGVRIWDTGKTYTQKGPMAAAWEDKANWVQVPYGTIDYKPRGDLMLEGHTFHLFLFNNKNDSVDLMAKIGDGGFANNEIYKVNDTGVRNFGHGTMAVKILKNTPQEVMVEHAGEAFTFTPPPKQEYEPSKWLLDNIVLYLWDRTDKTP